MQKYDSVPVLWRRDKMYVVKQILPLTPTAAASTPNPKKKVENVKKNEHNTHTEEEISNIIFLLFFSPKDNKCWLVISQSCLTCFKSY